MGRLAKPFPEEAFNDLYKRGYTDQQIAAKTGLSRATIYRHRSLKGLKSHRESGQRGCAISQYKPFWLQARAWMRNKEVARYIRNATDELRKDPGVNFNYVDAALAWVLEPGPINHPVPGPYEQHPEKMTDNIIERIFQFEELIDRSAASTGVPGIAIVDLVAAVKSKEVSESQKADYARRAVMEAGLTSAYATLNMLENGTNQITTPSTLGRFWAKAKTRALVWNGSNKTMNNELPEIKQMFLSAGVKLGQSELRHVYDTVQDLLDSSLADVTVAEAIKSNPAVVKYVFDPEVDAAWTQYQAAVHAFVHYWSLPQGMRPVIKAEKVSWSNRPLVSEISENLTIRRNQAFLAAKGY